MMKNTNPTKTQAWKKLKKHFDEISGQSIIEHFEKDKDRVENFSIQWEDFFIDYSKNRVTQETFTLLEELAKEAGLTEAIESYFGGEKINQTENRSVLHTALRSDASEQVEVDGKNIIPVIQEVKAKVQSFTQAVISGAYKGYTGKPITDIVNIGIGGSDLGPAVVIEALDFYRNHLNVHFVSNVEGDPIYSLMEKLNPETTLFVIVSKTFTTQETLTNAETLKKWFVSKASHQAIEKHFVAVSTNIEKVSLFGISPEYIFPMNDWVGGRFSLWSSVGLSIALSVGYQNFESFLMGAQKMDTHFRKTPFSENIPVILSLLSVWYNNFWNAESEAIIPYTQYLKSLPAYMQQGFMESNGKSIDRNGQPVTYQTGTIIWGAPGTNAQHAFFQLIHQGTKLIPCDFIGYKSSLYPDDNHLQKLLSNFIAQTEALMKGKDKETVVKELKEKGMSDNEIEKLSPFKVFEGNKPTNTFLINKLTPESLGKLISMYEHKIFVQGIIWNIFSFDQWGVELGKELATTVLKEIQTQNPNNHDESTTNLIKKIVSN